MLDLAHGSLKSLEGFIHITYIAMFDLKERGPNLIVKRKEIVLLKKGI